jgi:hypothetical protein
MEPGRRAFAIAEPVAGRWVSALRALFGFNYEGVIHDDDIELDQVVLAGFRLSVATGTSAAASPTPSSGETRAPKMGRSTFRWLRRR